MNHKRFIGSLLLILTLSGCSALGVFGLLSQQPLVGVESEIDTGDREVVLGAAEDSSTDFNEVEIEGDLRIDNKQLTSTTADSIVYNERTSPFVMLLLVVGWLLPTPNGLLRLWKSRKE
jgi:hypothetical protein